MKILFIANSAWYLKNFRSSTLRQFNKKFHVTCLHPEGDNGDTLLGLGIKTHPFFMDATSTNLFKELRSIFGLTLALVKEKPDAVFSFNPKTNLYSLIVCWLLRIPCIPNVSGVGIASQLKGLKGHIYRGLAGFFYKYAMHVFFQNREDQQAFLLAGWVKPDRVDIIPGSGVDLLTFYPVEKPLKPFRFLMAARLIKEKGVIEYIEAARKFCASNDADCEFYLAGVDDASSRAVPKDFLETINDEKKIFFVGHIKDMPSILKAIDCVVLPSYYPEGVPKSLIEAAAAGKVIITTNTPGCREVVFDGLNGFFVESKSVQSLVSMMHKTIELSPDQLNRMKCESRKLAVDQFDEKIVIKKYLDIADKIRSF